MIDNRPTRVQDKLIILYSINLQTIRARFQEAFSSSALDIISSTSQTLRVWDKDCEVHCARVYT